MGNFYSKFLDFIGIEEADDNNDNYYEEDRRSSYNRNDRENDRYSRYDRRNDDSNYGNNYDNNRYGNNSYSNRNSSFGNRFGTRLGRGASDEDVARTASMAMGGGQKMIVYHPVSYEDTQSIIDNLKNRKPIIVNMEELDVDTAQRILDFLSGAVYALDGTMCKIARNIFVVAPNSYDVVGSGEDTGYGEY